jgi:hypothetical protein
MAKDIFCQDCASKPGWPFDPEKSFKHACQRCSQFRDCNDYNWKTKRAAEPAPAPKELAKPQVNPDAEVKLPRAKPVETLHEGQSVAIPPPTEIPATGIPAGGIQPPAPPVPEMVPVAPAMRPDPVVVDAKVNVPAGAPPPVIPGRDFTDRPVAPAGAGKPGVGESEADAVLNTIHPKRASEGVRVTVQSRGGQPGKK